MGPHAHLAFERHLLMAVGDVTTEQELPPWILVSTPSTPDRTAAIKGTGPSPIPELKASLQVLKAAGANFAVITCNTSHHFLSSMESPLPILDIVEEALRASDLGLQPRDSIGILATTGTLEARVYQRTAEGLGATRRITTLLDLEGGEGLQQRLVMDAIYGRNGGVSSRGIKHGRIADEHRMALRQAALHLMEAGARVIILGCTEIPLALSEDDLPELRVVDPLAVAARAAIAIARGHRSLPLDLQRRNDEL
jgi:aspartate racemase